MQKRQLAKGLNTSNINNIINPYTRNHGKGSELP
uniref:Uncharacterized protein n=1 Tax=Anguilla anguilla TaxID=7936 RepID=A0A0E9VM03_ANGAN